MNKTEKDTKKMRFKMIPKIIAIILYILADSPSLKWGLALFNICGYSESENHIYGEMAQAAKTFANTTKRQQNALIPK